REHELTDPEVLGGAQTGGRQVDAVDLDDRDVRRFVSADDVAREVATVRQVDADLSGSLDHVLVRDQVARSVDHHGGRARRFAERRGASSATEVEAFDPGDARSDRLDRARDPAFELAERHRSACPFGSTLGRGVRATSARAPPAGRASDAAGEGSASPSLREELLEALVDLLELLLLLAAAFPAGVDDLHEQVGDLVHPRTFLGVESLLHFLSEQLVVGPVGRPDPRSEIRTARRTVVLGFAHWISWEPSFRPPHREGEDIDRVASGPVTTPRPTAR